MKKLRNLMLTIALLFSSIFSVVLAYDVFAEGADATTKDTFIGNGGEYDYEHILGNYNLFIKEDVQVGHINGAVVVGGEVNPEGELVYDAYNMGNPSYIKGKVKPKPEDILPDNVDEMPNWENPKNLYLGTVNDENSNIWNRDFVFTDNYVDFEEAFERLEDQSQQLMDEERHDIKVITDSDIKGESESDKYIVVKEGSNVLLTDNLDVNKIVLLTEDDSLFDSDRTIINFEHSGEFTYPFITITDDKDNVNKNNDRMNDLSWYPGFNHNDHERDGMAINLIMNFPNINQNLDVKNTDNIYGHIFAPKADVKLSSGNLNGSIIANSLDSDGTEIHMWPFLFNKPSTPEPDPDPELTQIFVEKHWKNENDEKIDAPEGADITVQLLKEKDGQNVKVENQEVTLSSSNNWKGSFIDLPILDDADDDIKYNVKEIEEFEGYTAKVTGNLTDGFVITNTKDTIDPDPDPDTTEITVEKKWKDEIGNEITQPDEKITIHLFKDEQSEPVKTAELDGSENWTHTFGNLAVENDDGSTIEYIVKEEEVDGYESDVSEIDEDNKIIVTNTKDTLLTPIEPSKTKIDVEKIWKDQDGEIVEDTSDLESVTIHLIADGDISDPVATVELNKDNNWKYTFSDLNTQTEDLEKITYSIKEEAVDGYKSNVSKIDEDNKIIVTNTKDTPLTPIEPSKTKIDVEKIWKDQDEKVVEDTSDLEGVTIYLIADGDIDNPVATVELNEKNNWKHTFSDLNTQTEDLEEITYSIKEETVDGYETSYSGNASDGFVITNTEEDSKVPEPEDPDSKGPKTPEYEESNEDKLPQTGEQDDRFLSVLGLLLIILPSIYLYNGRETKFK